MAFYRDTLSWQCLKNTYIYIFKQTEIQQFAVPTEPEQILTAQTLSNNGTRDELKNYMTGNL